jgi:hypothetical protein
MPEMKRAIKDSVFTFLFSEPRYLLELYQYLHPEDVDVTEAECKLITSKNVLSNGFYNDLGIQVRDKLILLVESQSTFSVNLPLRMLIYLAESYREYVLKNKISLYSSKPATVPKAELYVVYTGFKEHVPDILRLSDLCGEGSAEVMVKVLRGGDNSIIGQYVDFCKIADEQRAVHGPTNKAIRETIRICQEKGILVPFLASRRMEVVDIMELLFSQEEVMEMALWEREQQGIEKGIQKGIQAGIQKGIQKGKQEGQQELLQLYKELFDRMKPLGRTNELQEALLDGTKLFSLAKEFGIEI